MNVNMPSRLVDLMTFAPDRAAYKNLQMLGCDVEKARSMEWGTINREGVPVITLWDFCISVGAGDTAICDIPARKWCQESKGTKVGKAERLLEILTASVGKLVCGLICEHKNADGAEMIRRSAVDMCKWLVTEVDVGSFRLIRQDRAAREAST